MVCKPVTQFDESLHRLLDDMQETLKAAEGVGLAAPQVGIAKRLFIMDLGLPEMIEAINPQILKTSGNQHVMEGCLSCPDQWGYVDRPKRCRLRAQNRRGEWYEMAFTDLGAQCTCHEYDHLDGHLFIDIVKEFVDPEKEQ
jgi:peptide deformylase